MIKYFLAHLSSDYCKKGGQAMLQFLIQAVSTLVVNIILETYKVWLAKKNMSKKRKHKRRS